MADRGKTLFGGDTLPKAAAFGDRHVHLGMAFHPAGDASIRLLHGLIEKSPIEKHPEEDDEERDHDRSADELRQGELPTQEYEHDDAEFKHQIRRCHFERHCSREVGALSKHRARQRYCGIGARRRGRAEGKRDQDRARPIIRQHSAHLLVGDDGLHHGRERKAENKRPQDFPSHGDSHAKRA
jgi:hypothetical protein